MPREETRDFPIYRAFAAAPARCASFIYMHLFGYVAVCRQSPARRRYRLRESGHLCRPSAEIIAIDYAEHMDIDFRHITLVTAGDYRIMILCGTATFAALFGAHVSYGT